MTDLDLDVVMRYAALAPSVHNTQPWRVTVGDDTIEIRADRTRQLSFLDPTGRQLHLSCGAAVEVGYLALRDAGRACTVETLPESHDVDLIARLRVGEPHPVPDVGAALAQATPRRYTDRGPYDDRSVPAEIIQDIAHRCGELDVW